MTRPIYEPTPARTDAYLDFQEQQLFRRPAPPSGTATVPDEAWGQARNIGTATSVPNDFTAWTQIFLSNIDVSADGQTDIVADLTHDLLEIGADEGGTYILTCMGKCASGGGGTGEFEIGISLHNFVGTRVAIIPSPIVIADYGRAEERNEMTRLIAIPGEQGTARWLGVVARCSGNAVGQDVSVLLVARRLYMDSGESARAFVWL